jgi:hypothetical protein
MLERQRGLGNGSARQGPSVKSRSVIRHLFAAEERAGAGTGSARSPSLFSANVFASR